MRALRDAIVQYLIEYGLTDLSLRPLAKAVGSSPRGLLYYFGSKEKMLVQIFVQLRESQRLAYGRIKARSFGDACRQIWGRMSGPDSEPVFRVFFQAYGPALSNPELYKDYLRSTTGDWLQFIVKSFSQEGYKRKEARALATVMLAGLRGFMLDYCATRDRRRLDQAVDLWADNLDAMLLERKGGS